MFQKLFKTTLSVTIQMDRPPLKTDVTTITSGAEDVLEIVGIHEQLDRNAQRDDITV